MTILPQTVAKTYSYIIGVDTHARKHVYSIITYTGEHVETRDFPATSSSINGLSLGSAGAPEPMPAPCG